MGLCEDLRFNLKLYHSEMLIGVNYVLNPSPPLAHCVQLGRISPSSSHRSRHRRTTGPSAGHTRMRFGVGPSEALDLLTLLAQKYVFFGLKQSISGP
jgi:hypothetical protein